MRNLAPYISIMIAAYQAPDALCGTLQSVFEQTVAFPCEVIVVDSTPEEVGVREVVERFPASYIPVPNRGFAAANNVALARSRTPFIVLLNPDVILHDDAIGTLVTLLQNDATIGCASPRLLTPSGLAQPYAFGWEPTPRLLLRRGFRRLAGMSDTTEAVARTANMPVDVDWVAGTCLVARREAFASAGLLDERFFLYWEDVDWCLRVKRQGWRVVFDPRLSVTHLGGASIGSAAPSHYYRAMVRFYRKWYGCPAAILLAAILEVYAPLAAVVRRVRAHRD